MLTRFVGNSETNNRKLPFHISFDTKFYSNHANSNSNVRKKCSRKDNLNRIFTLEYASIRLEHTNIIFRNFSDNIEHFTESITNRQS